MKKWAILGIIIISVLLVGCSEASIKDARLNIDGKTYKVVEDTPINKTTDEKAGNVTFQPGLPNPLSDAKYYITDTEGNIYATRGELIPIREGIIRITQYTMKAPGSRYWIYFEGGIEFNKADVTIEQVRS